MTSSERYWNERACHPLKGSIFAANCFSSCRAPSPPSIPPPVGLKSAKASYRAVMKHTPQMEALLRFLALQGLRGVKA